MMRANAHKYPALAAALSVALGAVLTLAGCDAGNHPAEEGTGSGPEECSGQCANASTLLTVSDVQTILAQAVVEAQAQSAAATIAVVDRVGNVLAVFRMNGADTNIRANGGRGITTGLDGIRYLPDTLAAISKGITGAYLSSEGNAFSTRTASQIVQQNFNPGEAGQPGGPLFGVQFSNLPCSDLNTRFTLTPGIGPQRSPLGLSADPGGFPLYKDGTVVGGIGVIADHVYGLDLDASDIDRDLDELIALAGSYGYAAPADHRGDRITADGKTFRFSDVAFDDLGVTPGNAPAFASLLGEGALVAVTGYSAGVIVPGVAFGRPASGIRRDNSTFNDALDAFILVDDLNINRFPPSAGTDGAFSLTTSEVRTLLEEALAVANRTRAQIRRPLGSQARVTVSVVDTNGAILGVARTRDAPVFGTDVSLQKARTAAFFSGANAAADLAAAPDADYPDRDDPAGPIMDSIVIGDYVTAARDFLGLPTALADGAYAFGDRAGGNLSRPYFPDGQIGAPNGPFSKPFRTQWSPFSTGLQLDLSINRIIGHVAFTLGLAGVDAPQNCTTLARLPNGIQIFPGSVPIYRGNTLVGGIGVSGDGVDQDDMIAFLGLHNASRKLDINNAPANMRSDNLTPQGVRLRYVQCPQAPFLDSDEQNVCDGK
ncbi:MAG TPA: heme-binding protein [Gammaproteobacteria bacterium]|nr:heme-binding protein [Gammaproteobacteria bacterium]